jgi:hypothetical protein
MARKAESYCHIHGDLLVCPTCVGKQGGKKTAKIHKGKHSAWGKLGGRPKKKKRRANSKPPSK